MDPGRDRLKHLLVILLEALSVSGEDTQALRAGIKDKVSAAGLDDGDFHGLMNWLEDQWLGADQKGWGGEHLPESPSSGAFRHFGAIEWDYLSPQGMGFLVELLNNGQITRVQLEALVQYSSFIAIKPLDPYDLETVLEQVLFKPAEPGMTGGASEGQENIH
jgi:hypothetical protein